MKVLIVGTGIIGTIYGWALNEARVEITHLVRKGKAGQFPEGLKIDILDERKGYPKYQKTVYPARCIDRIENPGQYELIFVPVNAYQAEDALKETVMLCPDAFFFIMTSDWTGAEKFNKILGEDRYILGYPDAGGAVRDGVYWTNIGPEIHIGKPGPQNKEGAEQITALFQKANIKPDWQDNMLHWLWVHNASSQAIWAAFTKYKNQELFLEDKNLLKKSFMATRELLKLCEKRGVILKNYPDVSMLMHLPLWLIISIFVRNFRTNESMQRYTAHAENAPVEDLNKFYAEMMQTADEFHINMPVFLEIGKNSGLI